jgi:hypothetical protein
MTSSDGKSAVQMIAPFDSLHIARKNNALHSITNGGRSKTGFD